MNNGDIYIITALLPLSALMLVSQTNPYHALVIRGILGAVAALVYALFGAADVALTEALVGTMLSITLYAVAVRSSLNMKLGLLPEQCSQSESENDSPLNQYLEDVRSVLNRRHMRLELISYEDKSALQRALMEKEIHGICLPTNPKPSADMAASAPYHTTLRIRRLYEILQAEVLASASSLDYLDVSAQATSALDPAQWKEVSS